MLGSLLDQDEIEEFMAEADAVIVMLMMLLANCLSVCNGKVTKNVANRRITILTLRVGSSHTNICS